MKYYFRFHRGTLDESLKTTKVFNSEREMKDAIIAEYSPIPFELISHTNISIDEHSFVDPRVDWPNCHHVIVGFNSSSRFCVGFVCIVPDEDE